MARRADPEQIRQKKRHIATHAARLFATQGFENTSVAQIAEAAGTSAASIFYYFPDKASLFREPFEADVPAAAALIDAHRDDTDALEAILTILEVLASEAAYPHAQGMLVESLRRMAHDPELIAASEKTAATQRDGLAVLIVRAAQDGQIDASLCAGTAADGAADGAADRAAGWLLAIVDACFLNAEPGRSPAPEVRRTVLGYLKGPLS